MIPLDPESRRAVIFNLVVSGSLVVFGVIFGIIEHNPVFFAVAGLGVILIVFFGRKLRRIRDR
ncbi:MAG: hypothetical protein ACOH1T_03855 [Microbacteriaceae bacterium]